MSVQVFPTFLGKDIGVTRSAVWSGSSNVSSASGKETSIAYWANPLWQWEIKINFLRQGTRYGIAQNEMQQLLGFFNLRQGPFDSFLYDEPDDDLIIGQALGLMAGNTLQLVRTFGGSTEPILAPNLVANVYADGGAALDPATYTVSDWGTAAPGVITFTSDVPAPGSTMSADFSYYWPVRFVDQQMDIDKFLNQLFANKSIKMISKK